MKYFLIQLDHPTGTSKITEYDNASDALDARLTLDQQDKDLNTEVVVIGSASLDDLKVTHSRYFRADELPDIPRDQTQDQRIARIQQLTARFQPSIAGIISDVR